MICWFCKHIVTVPAIHYPKDTSKVNEHVSKSVQRVPCIFCGAQYDIDTYLAKGPKIDEKELKRLENKIR